METPETRQSDIARKVVTYSCGCARAVLGRPGHPPRPPMECPDHGGEFVKGETLDPETGRNWRPRRASVADDA